MKTITTVVKIFSGPDAIEKSPNRLRHSQMINITALQMALDIQFQKTSSIVHIVAVSLWVVDDDNRGTGRDKDIVTTARMPLNLE